MVFWEHKTELDSFLSIIEDTKVLVIVVDDDVWAAKDEIIGFLIDIVEGWHWLCL